MRKVLSIDLALRKSGITVLDEDGKLLYYTIVKTSKERNDLEEMLAVADSIVLMITELEIDFIVIESLSFGSVSSSTRTLAMLYGIVLGSIYKNTGKHVYEVAPTRLKKFFTGSGRAKKEDMFAVMPKDVADLFSLSYKKTTGLYDLTDSYALGRYALENILGGLKWNKAS